MARSINKVRRNSECEMGAAQRKSKKLSAYMEEDKWRRRRRYRMAKWLESNMKRRK